ncbi:MAG: protein of unknown function DUF723 [Caudoviricetes sp.]|nr:MAG: protein of unknown function DUF723 [Caudoviricetes sp.]
MFKSITQEEAISRFKNKHGDFYDYSLVEYKGTSVKVKIICPIHDIFECTPNNHTRGKGCPKCGRIKNSKSRSKTNEQFISEAIEVNGGEYDYSLVEYTNDKSKVTVICKKHDKFLVTPNNHLRGKGCPVCRYDKISNSLTLSQDEVISRFKEIHEEKYDYRLVEYVKATENVKIICKKHGIFDQTPSSHYNNQGCPQCGVISSAKHKQINPPGWSITNWEFRAKNSKNFDSFKVYIIRCWNESEEFYKIGRTFSKVSYRFRCYKLMPYKYEIVKEIIFDNASDCYNKETELKGIHKNLKYLPSLIFDGIHECFSQIIV